MPYERIGDRADDAHGAGSEARIQFVLQVDDIGRTVAGGLVIHPVIGRDRNGGAERDQLGDAGVDRLVVSVGLRLAGRVLVLHIVGGRQIHQVGLDRREKLYAGIEYKQRKVRRVLVGLRSPDKFFDVFNSVVRKIGAVRVFGRKTDTRHFIGQDLEQLVLGG